MKEQRKDPVGPSEALTQKFYLMQGKKPWQDKIIVDTGSVSVNV